MLKLTTGKVVTSQSMLLALWLWHTGNVMQCTQGMCSTELQFWLCTLIISINTDPRSSKLSFSTSFLSTKCIENLDPKHQSILLCLARDLIYFLCDYHRMPGNSVNIIIIPSRAHNVQFCLFFEATFLAMGFSGTCPCRLKSAICLFYNTARGCGHQLSLLIVLIEFHFILCILGLYVAFEVVTLYEVLYIKRNPA